MYEAKLRALEARRFSSKKPFSGSETETRKLLEGPKENNIFPIRGQSIKKNQKSKLENFELVVRPTLGHGTIF